MPWLDWTREGWRVVEVEPVHGQPHGPLVILREDFELPPGSRTYQLRDAEGNIVHGYIYIPEETD